MIHHNFLQKKARLKNKLRQKSSTKLERLEIRLILIKKKQRKNMKRKNEILQEIILIWV